MKYNNPAISPKLRATSYELRACLAGRQICSFVGKLHFSFGGISKSAIENKDFFYFGRPGSRLGTRGSQLLAGRCIAIFFSLLPLFLCAQAPPGCGSSDLRYLSWDTELSSARLHFAISPPLPGVQAYFLNYTLNAHSNPAPGMLEAPVPGVPQSFGPAPLGGLHYFTAQNHCADGSIHTGATIGIDMRNTDPECPAIRDFMLLDLQPVFIAFAWGAAPQADSFRVRYQADALPIQVGFTPEPVWEQPLAAATVHTFRIAALCTVPGLVQQAVAQGPEFIFSIIIIDDIKAIAVPVDTAAIHTALCNGYRIQCDHGDYGTDKERFISDHPQLGIPYPCPAVVAAQEIAPEIAGLRLSPNPTGENLQADFLLRHSGEVQWEVFDPTGRILHRQKQWLAAGAHRIRYEAQALPAGMYLWRLQAGGQFFSARWVKY